MALINTGEDKFIAKPNNPNEKMRADYVFLNIMANSKAHAQVDGVFYVIEKSKPQGMEEEEFVPQDIYVEVGRFFLGICETNIESLTFGVDCHKFAKQVLGSGFDIVEMNN